MSSKLLIFSLLFINIFSAPLAADTADYYYQRGELQYRGGMYDYALHSLNSALRIDGSRYKAANLLAEIYISRNRRDIALEYLEKSLSIKDDQSDIHELLGRQYEYFHDDKKAFMAYERSVIIDPNHIRANAALVRFYLDKNEKGAADRVFRISREEGTKKTSDLAKRAERYIREGKRADGLRIYETVLSLSPASEEIYYRVYEIRRTRGEMDQSARILERFLEIRPDHERTCLLLARIYTDHRLPGGRKRNYDKALFYLKKALEINPEGYEAHYQMSDIYRILKEKDLSEKHNDLGRKAEADRK